MKTFWEAICLIAFVTTILFMIVCFVIVTQSVYWWVTVGFLVSSLITLISNGTLNAIKEKS